MAEWCRAMYPVKAVLSWYPNSMRSNPGEGRTKICFRKYADLALLWLIFRVVICRTLDQKRGQRFSSLEFHCCHVALYILVNYSYNKIYICTWSWRAEVCYLKTCNLLLPASHCPDFYADGNTIMEIFKIGTDRIQIGPFVVSSLTIVEPSATFSSLRGQLREGF